MVRELPSGDLAAISETEAGGIELTDAVGLARAFLKVGDILSILPGPDGRKECPSHTAAIHSHSQLLVATTLSGGGQGV